MEAMYFNSIFVDGKAVWIYEVGPSTVEAINPKWIYKVEIVNPHEEVDGDTESVWSSVTCEDLIYYGPEELKEEALELVSEQFRLDYRD